MVIDHQLNPNKYTQQELDKNSDYAYASATFATSATSAYAAYAAYTASVDADDAYWFNEYFKLSGENKQDYIDAINKDNKQ